MNQPLPAENNFHEIFANLSENARSVFYAIYDLSRKEHNYLDKYVQSQLQSWFGQSPITPEELELALEELSSTGFISKTVSSFQASQKAWDWFNTIVLN